MLALSIESGVRVLSANDCQLATIGYNEQTPFTNYISVKSIDAMNQTIQANGGTIVLPKQEIGKGMGWISAFKDPDNNLIGLHQMPPAPLQKAPPKNARTQATKKKRK